MKTLLLALLFLLLAPTPRQEKEWRRVGIWHGNGPQVIDRLRVEGTEFRVRWKSTDTVEITLLGNDPVRTITTIDGKVAQVGPNGFYRSTAFSMPPYSTTKYRPTSGSFTLNLDGPLEFGLEIRPPGKDREDWEVEVDYR